MGGIPGGLSRGRVRRWWEVVGGTHAPRRIGRPGTARLLTNLHNYDRRVGSRPVSRVLSRAIIHLGRASPRASSDLPGSLREQRVRASRPACFPIWPCSRWGLPCRRMLPPARCALTAPFHPCRPTAHHDGAARATRAGPAARPAPSWWAAVLGGLLSVALSVGSRPPGVTWHLALWSPDFPPRLRAAIAWPTPARIIAPRAEAPAGFLAQSRAVRSGASASARS